MIHCCPKREYYVDNYLIPSMTEQGIKPEQIIKYNDVNGDGNLKSCIKSFSTLPENGATWHLQDDVMISKDFKVKSESFDIGIVAGFCQLYSSSYPAGYVKADKMWYSFPCIRIPNKIALGFVKWFETAKERDYYRRWVSGNKFDDNLFKDYLEETHVADSRFIYNLAPNIVEHIDYMIGGSTINHHNSGEAQSLYWEDKQAVIDLYNRIKADENFKITS